MGAILGVLFFVGIFTGAICLNAMVLVVLWKWFLIPLGLPSINLATAVGLGAIVSLFSNPCNSKEESPLLTFFFKLGFMLLIGWIAHQFV